MTRRFFSQRGHMFRIYGMTASADHLQAFRETSNTSAWVAFYFWRYVRAIFLPHKDLFTVVNQRLFTVGLEYLFILPVDLITGFLAWTNDFNHFSCYLTSRCLHTFVYQRFIIKSVVNFFGGKVLEGMSCALWLCEWFGKLIMLLILLMSVVFSVLKLFCAPLPKRILTNCSSCCFVFDCKECLCFQVLNRFSYSHYT